MASYLERALQAAESAQREAGSGDYNAACNRAYYAMFYAVQGLLEAAGQEDMGKTHASLLRLFSQRLVLAGEAPADLARALSIAQSLRARADYTLEGATAENAADAIAAMYRLLDYAKSRLPNS
ncbi:MAG: HEPN domain-containing protein [Rhizobiales bacterium]|nr:HEPN domain-containing protein [Hyphomicrobiales bacterium]